MYVLVQEVPQKESTSFVPRSPYDVSKLFAYWIINYIEAFNIFTWKGILLMMKALEEEKILVTKKITIGLSRIISVI